MATQIKRIFKIEGKEVEDQYPTLTPDRAKKMMCDTYPSIINSTWTERIDNGVLYVEFSDNVVGTRG